jgi:hypothetical protein
MVFYTKRRQLGNTGDDRGRRGGGSYEPVSAFYGLLNEGDIPKPYRSANDPVWQRYYMPRYATKQGVAKAWEQYQRTKWYQAMVVGSSKQFDAWKRRIREKAAQRGGVTVEKSETDMIADYIQTPGFDLSKLRERFPASTLTQAQSRTAKSPAFRKWLDEADPFTVDGLNTAEQVEEYKSVGGIPPRAGRQTLGWGTVRSLGGYTPQERPSF